MQSLFWYLFSFSLGWTAMIFKAFYHYCVTNRSQKEGFLKKNFKNESINQIRPAAKKILCVFVTKEHHFYSQLFHWTNCSFLTEYLGWVYSVTGDFPCHCKYSHFWDSFGDRGVWLMLMILHLDQSIWSFHLPDGPTCVWHIHGFVRCSQAWLSQCFKAILRPSFQQIKFLYMYNHDVPE